MSERKRMWLFIVAPAVDDEGTTEPFAFGTIGFRMRPTDDYPDLLVQPRLIAPASFSRFMGEDRSLFGSLQVGYGQVELANADGALDAFSRYGFGGREFEQYFCDADRPPAFPDGWTLLCRGYVQSCDARNDDNVRGDRQAVPSTLTIILRDMLSVFEQRVCSAYAGTGEFEGPGTVQGQAKPKLYGRGFNAPGVFLGSGVHQISDRPKCWANRLRITGTSYALAAGGDQFNYGYTTWASLVASEAFDPGTYRTWADHGIVKEGGVSGRVTVDWRCFEQTAYDTATDESARAGSVIKAMALDAGIDAGKIHAGDVAALDAEFDDVFGYRIADLDTRWLDPIGKIAASAAAYVGPSRDNTLRMRRIEPPSGTPVWEFNTTNCSVAMVPSRSGDLRVPAKSVKLKYARNWLLQDAGELAGITTGVRGEYAMDWVRSQDAAGTLSAKFLNALDLVFDSYTRADRTATGGSLTAPVGLTAHNLLDLFGVERYWLSVATMLTPEIVGAVDMADVVSVEWPRWGLATPRLFLVTGIEYLSAIDRVRYFLWG